jgi:hypothetical protein
MDKNQVIEKSWGEYWDLVKDHVGEQGWVTMTGSIHPAAFNKMKFFKSFGKMRSMSLHGLESNNGWTKTEDKIPTVSGWYQLCFEGKFWHMTYLHEPINEYYIKSYSHWMRVREPINPIY